MSRKVIELVQVLVDRIHQGGYTQRALEDDIYAESQKRIAAEKDRDHWKQARQDAIEAGELMQAEIETLRQELADAKRAASDEFTERQVLTVEQQQDAAAWQQQLATVRAENETLRQRLADAEHPPAMAQQRDEIAYLRARLDEERSVSAGLRDKLAEAQQPDVGAMRAFVGKVRACVWACYEWPKSWHKIEAALVELDAGTEPTPVAEPAPCPECERWQRAKRIDSELFALQKKRIDRLQGFVEIMRGLLTAEYADQRIIAAAIAELDDANSSATLTSSVVKESLTPTPVAEPLDAEGDTCPGK